MWWDNIVRGAVMRENTMSPPPQPCEVVSLTQGSANRSNNTRAK